MATLIKTDGTKVDFRTTDMGFDRLLKEAGLYKDRFKPFKTKNRRGTLLVNSNQDRENGVHNKEASKYYYDEVFYARNGLPAVVGDCILLDRTETSKYEDDIFAEHDEEDDNEYDEDDEHCT